MFSVRYLADVWLLYVNLCIQEGQFGRKNINCSVIQRDRPRCFFGRNPVILGAGLPWAVFGFRILRQSWPE